MRGGCRYIRGRITAESSQFFSHSVVKMIKQCAVVFGRSNPKEMLSKTKDMKSEIV